MKKRISLYTFIGLILGIIFGLLFKEEVSYIEFIGSFYIAFLKLMITPVIFTSISYTIYKTNKKDNIILKSVLLFSLMYTVTFVLTSIIVLLINPASNYIINEVEWTNKLTTFELSNIINIFPKNISDLFINPKVFFIILVAYLTGKLVKSERFFNGVNEVKELLFNILAYFNYLMPLAVFSLMANTVSKYGSILLGVGLKYILTAYICSVACMIFVMILPVCIKCHVSPLYYIKKVSKIWIMTLTTCSSAATLPYTVKLCNEELGIPKELTDVVVPLGCTIHMCGGAVSFALLGLFSSSLYGVEISLLTYILMLVSSLLINMAAPGIPGGGVVIGATYLNMLSIPLNFIGFYSGIYKLLDMSYTTLNVMGDISANMLLNNKK